MGKRDSGVPQGQDSYNKRRTPYIRGNSLVQTPEHGKRKGLGLLLRGKNSTAKGLNPGKGERELKPPFGN